ncbi:glycosyltransferase family 4 protein [bacterium]|nr:glycosyltransferase family 4 protein [bacterium]
MKLGIDLTIFRTYQGTEVFTENLMAHFVPKAIKAGHTVVIFKGYNQFLFLDDLAKKYSATEFKVINFKHGRHALGVMLTQQLLLPLLALRHKLNILYSTAPFFSFLAPCQKINTIHDAAYAQFKEFRNILSKWYIQTSIYLSHWLCKRVITVSDFSKTELISKYSFSGNKIVVIGNAAPQLPEVTELQDDTLLQKYQLKPKRYLFYVGSLNERKNIKGMMAAFDEFCKTRQQEEWQFVLAGNYNLDKVTQPLPQVKFIGKISNEEKVVLIRNAALMLFPSLYEGFGLPVLEAQRLNCPLITSNTTSLPEVAGAGALLVDPKDMQAIAKAISSIVNQEIDVPALIKRGQENLGRFSWEKSAGVLLETLISA